MPSPMNFSWGEEGKRVRAEKALSKARAKRNEALRKIKNTRASVFKAQKDAGDRRRKLENQFKKQLDELRFAATARKNTNANVAYRARKLETMNQILGRLTALELKASVPPPRTMAPPPPPPPPMRSRAPPPPPPPPMASAWGGRTLKQASPPKTPKKNLKTQMMNELKSKLAKRGTIG